MCEVPMVGASSGTALLELRVAFCAAVVEEWLDLFPEGWAGLNGSRRVGVSRLVLR